MSLIVREIDFECERIHHTRAGIWMPREYKQILGGVDSDRSRVLCEKRRI